MNPVDRRPGGPRLLFLATDLASGGGVNRVIRDLAVLLRGRLGAQVRVVNARSDRGSTYEFPREIAVESHRRQSLPSYFLLLLRLRRSRPDVVISSWTQDNILVALAFLFSRSRVVLVEHSSWDFHALPIRVLRRLTYPLASALVVLNRRDLDHFRRSLRNVRLIPNPVAVPPARAEAREKLILAIGHLEPLKQFDHAISAMAASGLEDEGWSLAIIGTGSEAPHLTKLIAELGLTRTSVHASVDDLSSWYARASLLLITSRLESFSLVLAEAMAAGVVPIAYASDGPSFILEDFPDHLVPVGDGAALAKRLAQLANDVQLEELRPKLRASIEKRFSPQVIADCWQDLLEG